MAQDGENDNHDKEDGAVSQHRRQHRIRNDPEQQLRILGILLNTQPAIEQRDELCPEKKGSSQTTDNTQNRQNFADEPAHESKNSGNEQNAQNNGIDKPGGA